jgi:hypothetical protein
VLPYAWKCLSGRSSLWLPALGCALILAAPGVVVATFLAVPAVSLAVTGDPALALSLLPDPLRGGGSIPAWAGISLAVALLMMLYARLYSVALWASHAEHDPGVGAAWRGSRPRWRSVLFLYLQGYGAVALALAALGGLVIFSGGPALSVGDVFIAGSLIVLARTVVRVVLTIALRAAILDDLRGRTAWRQAFALLRRRRSDAVAAWVSLLAAGVAVWIGGRLVSPVLQETSLAYPAGSSYTLLRESAQLLLSVPLEAFLMALSIGVWTAVYIGIENRPSPDRRGEERRRWWAPADPWLVRALAVLVVIVIVANGIPTAVDEAFIAIRRERNSAVQGREMSPDDLLGPPPQNGARLDTRYRVEATLEGRSLEWTTRINYRNTAGETLRTLGLNVYTAAFERELNDLPLARDLLATDLTGSLTSRARPGTIDVRRVTIAGRPADYELVDTALTIELPREVAAGEVIKASIALHAAMPEYPERFGVWDGITLLGNWVPVVALRDQGDWRFDEYGQIGDPFLSDVADYEVAIETGENDMIAGSGTLTEIEAIAPGRRRWHFGARRTRDVAFAIAPFLRVLETDVEGVTVRSWYLAEDRLWGEANLRSAESVVGFYATAFGDLPVNEIEVVATHGLLGGMEYPGLVMVSDTGSALRDLPLLPDLLRYAGFEDEGRRYVLAHEIAHQWWYATVGSDQVREPWLDEAMAEMSTMLWLLSTDGDDRTWRMTNMVADASPTSAKLSASVSRFASNRRYSDVVYLAGAALLMELRNQVGAETFLEILRTYYEQYGLKTASIDDFIDVVESIGGSGAARLLERHR